MESLALPAGTAIVGVHEAYPIHADLAHLSHDPALMGKILRKRQDEVARRARLLDPRQRTGGVPHDILAVQVAERKAAAEVEVVEDMYHAAVGVAQSKVMHELEAMKTRMARERHRATIDFSAQNLGKEQRREFALSDPSALRNEVQMSEEEFEQLGPCAMQKFKGQEGQSKEERTEMRQTMAGELAMQVREKQARELSELEWNRHMDEQAALANQVRDVCERDEREDARSLKVEESEINQAIAAHHAARKTAKLQREEQERQTHLTTVVQQDKDRMADDYKVGYGGKILKAEYRRMTVEEEQDVYNNNAQQILEKRIRKQQEVAEEAQHAKQTFGTVAVLNTVASMQAQMSKERTRNFLKENESMAAAKREQDAQDRVRYKSYDYMP